MNLQHLIVKELMGASGGQTATTTTTQTTSEAATQLL